VPRCPSLVTACRPSGECGAQQAVAAVAKVLFPLFRRVMAVESPRTRFAASPARDGFAVAAGTVAAHRLGHRLPAPMAAAVR
jgi:hypothetical protein